MEWFVAAVAVAALGVAAVAAAGGAGEMGRYPVEDVFRADLPEGPLSADDLRAVRFGTAFRGYAMDQVDDLVERLAAQIAQRDARIAELGGEVMPSPETGPQPWADDDTDPGLLERPLVERPSPEGPAR